MRLTPAMACVMAVLAGAVGAVAAEVTVTTPEELSAALKAARPGDTVVMADGVWADTTIVFDAEGTAQQPITLRAQTPGQAKLTGKSRLRIGGAFLVVDGLLFAEGAAPGDEVIAFRRDSQRLAHDCRLTNCAIIDYNPPEKKPGCKWLSLYGINNRVDHCYLKGKTDEGTTLVVWVGATPNHHRIDHNLFGPREPLGVNGGETIRVGTSEVSMNVSATVVEDNVFDGCQGEAEIISSKSCENIYRYNTFLDSGGALTLRHGNRCVVEGNWFFGHGKSSTGGIRIIGEDHQVLNNYMCGLGGRGARAALSIVNGIPDSELSGYWQVKRALIAFNTIVDCKTPLVIGLSAGETNSLPPLDCTIANNVIVGNTAPIITQAAEPVNMTWQGNVVFGADLGIAQPAGITVADPKLTLGEDGLWRPGPDSPLTGAAQGSFPAVTQDIDGHERAGRLDVGCDQRSDAPVQHRPLKPSEVGPDWLIR